MPVTNPRKTYLNFRNSTLMLYKNTPARHLVWRVSLKLLLDLVAAIRFYLTGKSQDGRAVLKALRDFVKYRKRWRKSREGVPEKIGRKPGLMLPQLLVVERYKKGKKEFSKLDF